MTLHDLLLMFMADLAVELPAAIRLQRMVGSLRAYFGCGAVALLRREQGHLCPVAVDGLVGDVLGRRFAIDDHPRLAAILAQPGVLSFDHDSRLPDPYDGLVEGREGQPLAVHDCMGMAIHIGGQPWGALTLDTLDVGAFGPQAQADLAHLASAVEALVRTTALETTLHAVRLPATTITTAGGASATQGESEIVGQSEALTRLLHELDVVADSELPVLLLGETGVGKELLAHRLHRLSRRRAKPLVHVNCAALPEALAESELFGHARGAFSGAMAERAGRFEAADGGTMFLDEVGELPLAVQAKLLRTLQNGEIQRLGADQPRRVNVRVIAATNRDLRAQVASGAFRADLYHRLSVYPIPIPPLRERGSDVLLLAGRFLELNRARLGLRSLRLSPDAQAALCRYRWPGNVRELEHVISRAALKALSRGAERKEIVTLEANLLDLDAVGSPAPAPATSVGATPGPAAQLAAAPAAAPAADVPLRDQVDDCQRRAIEAALAAHHRSWAHAARALDVDPSNLHKLARRLGLKGMLSKHEL